MSKVDKPINNNNYAKKTKNVQSGCLCEVG